MEMNTRIQVEHPVTEMVTGIDLIEQMILIAEGEKLQFKQKDIKLKGWAIEFRINAEDVQSGFSPSLGTIEKISWPESENVRVDTGVRDGSVITPYYDSMIAKLIVHADTREEAIKRMARSLDEFIIGGIKTTIKFHQRIMNNKEFIEGDIDTGFNNGRTHQDIEFTVIKIRHNPFQGALSHLSMSNSDAGFRHQRCKIGGYFINVFHFVMEEIDLATTQNFT